MPGLAPARRRAGLSQVELSRQIDVQGNIVAHFERGRRAPSWPIALRLADALGVTLDELAGRDAPATATMPALRRLLREAKALSARDIRLLIAQAQTLRQHAEKS